MISMTDFQHIMHTQLDPGSNLGYIRASGITRKIEFLYATDSDLSVKSTSAKATIGFVLTVNKSTLVEITCY